jgi:hypothetical protein
LEETGITPKSLKLLAKFSCGGGFAGIRRLHLTTFYMSTVEDPDLPYNVDLSEDIQKINYEDDNGEVEHLLFIKLEHFKKMTPEELSEIKVSGHHLGMTRKAIERVSTENNDTACAEDETYPYLKSFEYLTNE